MLHVVQVTTDRGFTPLVEAGLELLGSSPVYWQDAETGTAVFEEYLDSEAAAAQRAAELEALLREWSSGETWSVGVRALADADWRDSWKRFFHAEQVSPNIWVHPPWEPVTAEARCVVEINPGLSFGTGRHFTTRTCLQLMDALTPPASGRALLDAGCGSGILAIAAAKLGYAPVDGVDFDPQAVHAAGENAVRNGVVGRVRIVEGDVGRLGERAGQYDVVVANLQDEILRRHAAVLVGCARAGDDSRLIVSGILCIQWDGVRAAFGALGWHAERVLQDAEWTTACLARGAGANGG